MRLKKDKFAIISLIVIVVVVVAAIFSSYDYLNMIMQQMIYHKLI